MLVKWLPVEWAIVVATCAGVASGQPVANQPDAIGGYSTRRLIVELTAEAEAKLTAARTIANVAPGGDVSSFLSDEAKALTRRWRASAVRPLYSRPFRDPALAARLGLDRVYVVDVPVGADTPAMATNARALAGELASASVDGIGGVAFQPDDPSFNLQYALDNTGQIPGGVVDADIDAVEAWSIHTGDLGTVTIAIIDSGVDPHPEFSSRMVPGINTNDPGNPTLTIDGCPHGTHVAGIAAASGNNGMGIAGVTWGANVMPVRVLSGCSGFVSDLASGIVWAADHGANVLNVSLQYYNLTVPQANNLQNAVNYARSLGAVIVAAAGNNNQGGVGVIAYPARLPGVLAVTATDHADAFATFSNFGPQAAVSAPGKDIFSTWTAGGYNYQFGTSMAAPHVAGVAALLKSYDPNLVNGEIDDLILHSTDDLGPVGWDNRFGWGRLNALTSLNQVECVARITALEPVETPIPDVPKTRAISFVPFNAGRSTAIRVTLSSLHHPNPPYTGGPATSFAAFEGQARWVGPPEDYVESTSSQAPFRAAPLQCTPHYMDWSTVGLIHVYGTEIIPSSTYRVEVVREGCDVNAASFFTESVTISTARWGDIEAPFNPPESSTQPDFTDIAVLVNKFKSLPSAPVKARAVIAGNLPDYAPDLGFDQISACVDAFKGFPYPYPGPSPCP